MRPYKTVNRTRPSKRGMYKPLNGDMNSLKPATNKKNAYVQKSEPRAQEGAQRVGNTMTWYYMLWMKGEMLQLEGKAIAREMNKDSESFMRKMVGRQYV